MAVLHVPSQHVMKKFSICKGKDNTQFNSVSKTSIKSVKVIQKMKPKKYKVSELGSNNIGSANIKEVAERNGIDDVSNDNNKDEVEEGELGTLPFDNEEFVPEKTVRRYEIKSEIEKGEVVPGKWRKGGNEWEKNDWSLSKEELEKGEFVPERWCRNDAAKKNGEFGNSKARRYDATKEKGWKNGREWMSHSSRERGWRVDCDSDWSPPSAGKHSSVKERGRSIQNSRKFSSRYEAEKTPKINSKIASEEGTLKNDFTNSKSHARDYSFGNRFKRHGGDFGSSERKYHVDYEDYSGPKNRKLSDDVSRSGFPSEQYSGRSMERSYKIATTSSRSIPSERYSSRYMESSRATHNRHNSSPHHSERSSYDRSRNHDHRDGSPARRGTPSYDRSRSPYDRSHHYDNRGRSPIYVEASPRNQFRNRDGKDQSPTLLERSPRDRSRYTDHCETNRRPGADEKRPSHYGNKGQEGKHNQKKDSGGRKLQLLAENSPDRGSVDNQNVSTERISGLSRDHAELPESPSLKSVELSQENGTRAGPEGCLDGLLPWAPRFRGPQNFYYEEG